MNRTVGILASLMTLVFFAGSAEAATNVCGTVQALAATTHQWITSLGTNCQFVQSQPAVGDLANVSGGTVLGNATGSSAAPTATATPVLGVASSVSGTLGLANSGTANVVTLQNVGATSAYNFNLPNTVGSAGQALVSEGGGSTAMQWASILAANFTVTSKTTSFLVTTASDFTRYDNTGAGGAVTFTLPASPSAGDNWCFAVTAAQTLEVLANTGETINVGGTVSASAGNIQSNTVGANACLAFHSATVAYAEAFTGPWTVN